jgi:hypothetical protein
MRKLRFYRLSVLFLCFPFMASNLYARDCSTPSPNMQSVNNAWAPIPSQHLSPAKLDKVLAFLQGIVGTWKGKGRSTECLPSANTFESRKIPQTLRLSVDQYGGSEFNFKLDVFDTRNQTEKMHAFIIQQTGHGFQVAGEGNIALISASKNSVKFRTQYRLITGFRRGMGGGNLGVSVETIREVSLEGGELILSKAEFHNGVMIDFGKWVFSKN